MKRQSVGTWVYEESGVKQAPEWPEEKILEDAQPAPDSVVELASRR